MKLGIIKPSSSGMMMAWMMEINASKLVFGGEILEEFRPFLVVRVAVGISSDIYWTSIGGQSIIKETVQ